MTLRDVYFETLVQCAPERLVRDRVSADMPRNVVAIGKCAGALLDGVAGSLDIENAFAAIPAGYPHPRANAEVHTGGHPLMTAASFAAGTALLDFVSRHRDILFLISGGGSACVEVPLPGISEATVGAANEQLIRSGLPIGEINRERRRFSAIKGGRLRERVRGRCVTLVYSDVSTGALQDVASGPTITSSDEAVLIADNGTMVSVAAAICAPHVVAIPDQIECDVEEAAALFVTLAGQLAPGQTLVAGGEPTVQVRGEGRGGRCSELAVRFALAWDGAPLAALFASSDGVDGNSGFAGVNLPRVVSPQSRSEAASALERSDTAPLSAQIGEPIMIAATGNNLRDLFMMARL